MDLTRRDMFKLGALGAIGTAGASQLPWSSVIEAQAASLLAVSDTPLPFRTGFVRPPVLRPDRSRRDQDGVWTDYFTVRESARRARILPTMSTLIWGYNGMAPGPTIKVRRGRRAVMRVINQLPNTPSLAGAGLGDVSAPARFGVATAVRRVRQRRHRSRVVQGLRVPELPARTNALVPRPWGAPHRPERVRGPVRAVPPARRGGAGTPAAGRVRRTPDGCRRPLHRQRCA